MAASSKSKTRKTPAKIFHLDGMEYRWKPPGYRGGIIPTALLKKAVRAALAEEKALKKGA